MRREKTKISINKIIRKRGSRLLGDSLELLLNKESEKILNIEDRSPVGSVM